MSVANPDKKESKTEFDRVYYRILADSIQITDNKFGARKDMREKRSEFIKVMCERVDRVVADIGTHIRIANSIYPKEPLIEQEAKERRIHQEKAIGLCFDLLTKYTNTMHILEVSEEKYVEHLKNVVHEINCLKRWRSSDDKRFRLNSNRGRGVQCQQ